MKGLAYVDVHILLGAELIKVKKVLQIPPTSIRFQTTFSQKHEYLTQRWKIWRFKPQNFCVYSLSSWFFSHFCRTYTMISQHWPLDLDFSWLSKLQNSFTNLLLCVWCSDQGIASNTCGGGINSECSSSLLKFSLQLTMAGSQRNQEQCWAGWIRSAKY